MPKSNDERILRDEVIVLSNPNKPAPELMRRVVALIEIDGEEREMVFFDQQPGMESPQCGRPLPMPMADRGVL